MIFSEIEKAPRKEIEKIQLERLKKAVKYAYDNVPFYKKKYDEANVSPDDIKSLEDISKLPFTTKQDLRDNYPYGLMAVDMKDIVRVHASSGTSGKPTVVFYTRADLEMWSECVARIIAAAGGTDKDIVQIAFGYGLFTGALGLHQGWEKIGAAVVPASSGNTERQVMLMKDLKVTALVSTPSYALYISEVMEKMGVKNVEFIKVISEKHIKINVWERGCGITLACGTGACASTVAAILNNLTENKVKADLPGGTLTIEWAGNSIDKDNDVFMTGSAKVVFEGEYLL